MQVFKKSISEFIPIKLNSNHDLGSVFLNSREVSKRILIVSLKPVVFGIWLEEEPVGEKLKLTFNLDQQHLTITQCRIIKNIKLNNKNIVLCDLDDVELPKLNFIQRAFELSKMLAQSRKSKFEFNKKDIKKIASAYYYPRKVRIAIVQGEDYLNIFPMDLHLRSPMDSNYMLALQPSNLAERQLKKNKKILVGEIPYTELKNAYQLGGNHGKTNLFNTELPFKTTTSKLFNFLLPEFCFGYKEIVIDEYESVGSHTLFVGQIMNEEKAESNLLQPYHIHRFHYQYCIKNKLIDKSIRLDIA